MIGYKHAWQEEFQELLWAPAVVRGFLAGLGLRFHSALGRRFDVLVENLSQRAGKVESVFLPQLASRLQKLGKVCY